MKTRFEIGQEFMSSGRNPRLCTVIDIHKTYNSKGELVKLRYVAEHKFMGKKLIAQNICETEIAKGLVCHQGTMP